MAAGKPTAIFSERNIMITTVLFDLDGTLLPMELDGFLESYFSLLTKKLSAYGYDPHKLMDGMWEGLMAMIGNDGSRTNEETFFAAFSKEVGRDARIDLPLFEDFYLNEFHSTRSACGFDPKAVEVLAAVKAKGLRVVLATNPIYPAIATESRIRWAGFEPDDFELYTTYEHFSHSKPNPAYYQDILDKLDLRPEECLMVGNDAQEDMAAKELGIHVFLLPRYLINRHNLDISSYPQGNFEDLLQYIDKLQKMD